MQYFDLRSDAVIDVVPAEALDPTAEARVDAIWRAETGVRGAGLFNGPVYSVIEHNAARIQIAQTDYRHLTAFRRAPEIFAGRGAVRPLGVTGFLFCPEGVVLGRRAPDVALYPECWEPAPSGHLAMPDAKRQLLDELTEELGLPAESVTGAAPFALAFDEVARTFDILFRLETTTGPGDLRALHQAHATHEYTEIAVVAPADFKDFVARRGGGAVPLLFAPLPAACSRCIPARRD